MNLKGKLQDKAGVYEGQISLTLKLYAAGMISEIVAVLDDPTTSATAVGLSL